MKESTRIRLIAYGLSAAVALVIVVAVSLRQGLLEARSFREVCRDLSDGFFVAGLMMSCVGGLSCIAATGFFDIFSYGARTVASHFVPQKDSKGLPKYYDYKVARDEKRKKPLSTVLTVGLVCVGLSLAFVLLYFR